MIDGEQYCTKTRRSRCSSRVKPRSETRPNATSRTAFAYSGANWLENILLHVIGLQVVLQQHSPVVCTHLRDQDMMIKNPSCVLCSYSKSYGMYLFQPVTPSPAVSNSEQQPIDNSFRRHATQKPSRRTFATIRDRTPKSEEIQWPKLKSTTAIPSPYQIFQQKKNAPYSKQRFYELVKLYHPDRYCHGKDGTEDGSLSHTTKIERYRLVVAANDILSHPAKRSAYDKCGAGWNGRPDAGTRSHEWRTDSNGHWSGFRDNSSPARNATWEDWEKWYQRNEKGEKVPHEPVYFSNEGFLSLIAIIACLGGIGQATRIGDQKKSYLKQMETIHSDCSLDARRRMEEAQRYGTKDKRVQSFLSMREQSGVPTIDMGEGRKLLPTSK